MQRWADVEDFLVDEAAADLVAGRDVRPCLVAFDSDEPLFVAFLRSFAKGCYDEPIIELLALAGPLGANRLALAVGGRAWSLDDPIPPVLDGVGDLRQRVLCITRVDGASGPVQTESALYPFATDGARVRWDPVVRQSAGKGWIPAALALAVQERAALTATAAEARRQARRCVELGHLLGLADAGAERLEMDGSTDAFR